MGFPLFFWLFCREILKTIYWFNFLRYWNFIKTSLGIMLLINLQIIELQPTQVSQIFADFLFWQTLAKMILQHFIYIIRIEFFNDTSRIYKYCHYQWYFICYLLLVVKCLATNSLSSEEIVKSAHLINYLNRNRAVHYACREPTKPRFFIVLRLIEDIISQSQPEAISVTSLWLSSIDKYRFFSRLDYLKFPVSIMVQLDFSRFATLI